MLKEYILNKEHHKFRREINDIGLKKDADIAERVCERFEKLCALEKPVILPEEKICFIRTIKKLPVIISDEEWTEIRKNHFVHELGFVSNMCPEYGEIIKDGLLKRAQSADEYGKREIAAIIDLTDRYRMEAKKQGRKDIAETLENVPRYGARNFREALQFLRILHYSLWLEGSYHNTLGRFDKYMYPYLKKDMDDGIYTEDSALELLEDFFVSFNKDSDLYTGVQQGDNGQSMVLGGVDEDGNDVFNLLSKLCLKASKNLMMIDPKINLRVNKNTPMEIFELGSELTKAGLGFPQYSNDDIVIEGLERVGYDRQDAVNYAVAACWEFIIPGKGADIPNIGALSFPKVVNKAMYENLMSCETFGDFKAKVYAEIAKECDSICDEIKDVWIVPSPLMTVYMPEIKYHNFGIHGTGIATATDSMYAIKKHIYEDRDIQKEELLEAVRSDFKLKSELLPKLRFHTEKMGNDVDEVDNIASDLLKCFSDNLSKRKNCMGGSFRAGTGSAMYYLWHANEIGASADGRREGEPFGTNFSPSLFSKIKGPFSVIKSFTKQNFINAVNGGPLTLEFHHSMVSDDECVKKVAALVKAYISLGGIQLQLNVVNIDKMKDAQKHPEKYPQLVVRIWGWSAYFVELDKEFQNHVIKRQEYTI